MTQEAIKYSDKYIVKGGKLIIGTFAAGDSTGNHQSLTGAVYIGQEAGNVGVANYQTAIGYQAGYRNYGGYSAFVGFRCGGFASSSSSGNANAAIGYQALYSITSGSDNAAVGMSALEALTTGNGNCVLGRDAGDSLLTGNYNTIIGQNATCSATNASYEINIGHDIAGTGTRYMTVGTGGSTSRYYLQVDANTGWTRHSDQRYKKNIQSSTLGLEFINALRTVTFHWKAPNELESDIPGYDAEKTTPDNENVQRGFIAQEVKQVLDDQGVTDFGGWVENKDGMQGIGKESFIDPLIKAVQELSAEVTALKAEVAALKGE